MTTSQLLRPLAVALAVTVAVAACSGTSKGITIKDPYVRVTGTSEPAAAYFVIVNDGDSADSLLSVSSPAFGSVTLHQTMVEASPAASMGASMGSASMGSTGATASMAPTGMASMPAASMAPMGGGSMVGMQSVAEIAIPAHGSQELKPGGYHVMLDQPTGTIAVGQKVQLTLTFRNAGTITVTADVRGV